MDANLVKSKFEKLGARAVVGPLTATRWRPAAGSFVIDIRHDRRGEFFAIQAAERVDLTVLDLQPKDRHLLLMARSPGERSSLPDVKDKFLCGHDERHWFVAAVPEQGSVSSVVSAKEALKPDLVRQLESGRGGKLVHRLGRRTETFVRQGEWFFVPAAGVQVDQKLVLRREPIRRGGGKPHRCEFLFREGGTTVYVCSRHPNGLTGEEYHRLLKSDPKASKTLWTTMRRNPLVFVRGKISHPDHATLRLDNWHRVEMNTENRSRAMAHLAFLD